ncbi:MAG: hypothetical protein BWX71_01486 [Deltaproteobacteria bacterium ADurb.Bin072]|nr:MAG: hypothetical protein BWX71_01486 [Deltaproteobacteria bacterium ADurb.Bin072]
MYPSLSSTTARVPPESLHAISMESIRRETTPSLSTTLSITTSMVCFLFLSSFGTSSRSKNSPFMRTRTKPSRESLSRSFAYSPLRPVTTGARSMILLPGPISMTDWAICWMVMDCMGLPQTQQWGVPVRAKRTRR